MGATVCRAVEHAPDMELAARADPTLGSSVADALSTGPDVLVDFSLFPDSKRIVRAYLEPGARQANAEDRYQFERHGYFVADRIDSKAGTPVFNRIVSLRDSWTKPA